MIFLDLFGILGVLIQCLSLSFFPLVLGRIICGMVIGLNSGTIPRYIFGVTPRELSGSIVFFPQTIFTIGLTFAYALGFTIDPL
jgi:predicted MFS family arabinose efflux permease